MPTSAAVSCTWVRAQRRLQVISGAMTASLSQSHIRHAPAAGNAVPAGQRHYHRKLQQNIDPLSYQLNKLACVNDTSIYPFSTFGRLYHNDSFCMGTLVGPDTVYTIASCFDANNLTGTYFAYGGSSCSGTSLPLMNANAISTFVPDQSACGNDAYCLSSGSYGLIKLDTSFPNWIAASSDLSANISNNGLINTTINLASWTGMPSPLVAGCQHAQLQDLFI